MKKPRQGIILAAGMGTRLAPVTRVINKHLLLVFNKPMVYYPLSTLISAGCSEITIVCHSTHLSQFEVLLGDGERFGVTIDYALQPSSGKGIPAALMAARKRVDQNRFAVMLGDNVFVDDQVGVELAEGMTAGEGAVMFLKQVSDPRRYGVADLDADGRIRQLREKPKMVEPALAITGLYVLDQSAFQLAGRLIPSGRGELEIVDVLGAFLADGRLRQVKLGEHVFWSDAGTPESLLETALKVATLESSCDHNCGFPELAAVRAGFLTADRVRAQLESELDCAYVKALLDRL